MSSAVDSSAPPPATPTSNPTRFGTVTGVFLPTLLTILGVIMYVRIGWVVGNAGLGGAMVIMGLGILITTCTGLSLSSIATNTRIGPGGPYAIMNRSLGVEVGGAIGIPLFLTRPLGVAMYIIGFREGLLWVFPELPSLPVDLGIFAVLFAIAFKSADLAFKTQYVILAVVGASLISIFSSAAPFTSTVELTMWGDYRGAPETGFVGADFWMVFAVFFPATTGILAGANMSGDLKDPRRAIPYGTLWAIAISSVLYFAVAVWVAKTGTTEELTSNYNHLIDKARVPGLVLAGLLGATASSALAGLVGGPRILMAMGQNKIVPFSDQLAKTVSGEPRAAIVVTGVLTVAAILVRDLNTIAPLVTMFFLITYCMINVVVLLEGSLGLVSYRPTLKVPLVVPLAGLIGCMFSMFIVNPTFSLVSVVMVAAVYVYVRRRNVASASEDVRSSIFVSMAEWAAAKVTREDVDNVRAWKPHLLVPVEDSEELRGSLPVLLDLARPEGSIKLLGVTTQLTRDRLEARLNDIGDKLQLRGERVSWTVVDIDDFQSAVNVGVQALQGAFFRPNLIFARLSPSSGEGRDAKLNTVVRTALSTRVGVVIECVHPTAGLGERKDIRLWIRPAASFDANDAFEHGSIDLVLLMGFRLARIWRGRLVVTTVVEAVEQQDQARRFLDEICDLARFPARVEREVLVGDREDVMATCSVVDLSIFGLRPGDQSEARLRGLTLATRSSCVFVLDSGRESARV